MVLVVKITISPNSRLLWHTVQSCRSTEKLNCFVNKAFLWSIYHGGTSVRWCKALLLQSHGSLHQWTLVNFYLGKRDVTFNTSENTIWRHEQPRQLNLFLYSYVDCWCTAAKKIDADVGTIGRTMKHTQCCKVCSVFSSSLSLYAAAILLGCAELSWMSLMAVACVCTVCVYVCVVGGWAYLLAPVIF